MHDEPGYSKWALPGGFVGIDENLDDAAYRVLNQVTGVHDIFMEQVRTFGKADRYPGERVITTAYYALINPRSQKIKIGRDVKDARWVSVGVLPPLVFDHADILKAALKKLKRKLLKMGLLIKLNEQQKGVPHRAAFLYKFDRKVYDHLRNEGFVFDL